MKTISEDHGDFVPADQGKKADENISSLDASSVPINVPVIPLDYLDRNPDVTETSSLVSV
ncbi:hypothetical protein A2U01_0103467, partial [Trifolium medium]|nr:hypothetical protein [Trifolium medium]